MKSINLIALCVATALSGSVYADNSSSAKGGSFKSSEGDSQFKVNGRLMFDWDAFDGANNISNAGDSAAQSEIRRARIAVTSQLDKRWKAKLQVDYNDAKAEATLKDAYIQRKGDSATVTIGKHKEPMGLEELTSSKYISTIERAMVTDALAPSRNMGVSFKTASDNLLWQGGIFKSADDADNSNNENYAFTGRVVLTPSNEKGDVTHLGASFSQRDLGNNSYQIKTRAEVHTADKIVTSALVDAESMTLFGLEGAMVKGPFSLQSEYYSADVSANVGEDATFDGFYVMASYFTTGESRPYKGGAFAKVKPNSADGAWELVARYSVLDGQDNNAGVKGENITLGVNYYLNASMRFMANYINTQLTSDAVLAEEDGNALSLRFQYIW